MSSGTPGSRKAQLDADERSHLEDVVESLRETVETEIEFELEHQYDLAQRAGGEDLPADEQEFREELVTAINYEDQGDRSWDWCYQQYAAGVGYTIINRLAALRCMEVRGFLDRPVTQIGDSGLSPAAERLLNTRFDLDRGDALVAAYREECEEMADEIEILFDTNSRYSLIEPDPDLFRELVEQLDQIPDDVWRADDVLGWVYEYYNRPVVEALDAKNSLEPEDVGPANQFYTPHWVVRMLADNSLGKLYLEATDQTDAIPKPESLSPEERKDRLVTSAEAPSVPELCTYLIPDEEPGDAPEFDHPRDLRVIDPACGSGHFLLYAFDILERIWWQETDLDWAEIPAKVLEHNLYGVDIDLRSCQLSAFNLYLKARTRAEEEDGDFEMPNVGIVCADAGVAEVEEATNVLDEITGEGSDLRAALDEIIETFQHTEALGSLLDVSGTLEEAFDASKTQTELGDYGEGIHQSLNSFLKALQRAVADRTSDSFGEQKLRSFLNLLVVLTQEYDTALMNPPYGSRGRMPDEVQKYVDENYKYTEEYYINFFEVCDQLVRNEGRVGMLIPHAFMFSKAFQSFREDFVGERGGFDFFAEFGYDILDNATVGTVGTVVRSQNNKRQSGTFIRLSDISKSEKENTFLESSFNNAQRSIKRVYNRELSEFDIVPGTPLSYWVPKDLRSLYESDVVLDNKYASDKKEGLGAIRAGVQTGKDARFLRKHWEGSAEKWVPFAKGGSNAWMLPEVTLTILWADNGKELRRKYENGNGAPNEQYYFKEALTYTVKKRSGKRFGYLHGSSIFAHIGSVFVPDHSIWQALSYTNSHLFTYLMLSQTSERNWEVGLVANVPWRKKLAESGELGRLSRKAVDTVVSKRKYNFASPHYDSPLLLDVMGVDAPLSLYDHPHRQLHEGLQIIRPDESASLDDSVTDLGTLAARYLEQLDQKLQSYANQIDEAVFDCFDITDNQRETILQEIALRTIEDPREQEEHDPESITEPSDDFPQQLKDLLLHFALRAVSETDDGIIPISGVDGEDDLLTHIEAEFERVWGDRAADRLAEVDDLLGSESAAEEAYPNLRRWLADDLFDYHVSKFDRTPILWRFTTERLVSDAAGEGFGCLVDYHQLDEGIFDRLQNRYLEPRKSLLRERRSAANRRRSDETLSTSAQAEAAEQFDRVESQLEQIALFEEQFAELAQPDPRQWSDNEQQAADTAAERVAEFRRRTEERLEIVDELTGMEDVDMGELFTENFYEKVGNQREEWIDALEDLEAAFGAYAADSDQPVEAHLYDLFDYYSDDLLGSSHFASNGILYMTYYFDKFEQTDQERLDDADISRRQRLISRLARDLDGYIELGKSISDDCEEVSSEIPSDWADRALSEITTAGYQPNHKHGVAINITPLAEQEIVPEIVEDKVI